MTVAQAKQKAETMKHCKGICFRGSAEDGLDYERDPVEVFFKNKFDKNTGSEKWTSLEKKIKRRAMHYAVQRAQSGRLHVVWERRRSQSRS